MNTLLQFFKASLQARALILALVLTFSALSAQLSPAGPQAEDVPVLKQSLRFEENAGQLDEQVLFKVNDAQATHFFLDNEIRSVISGDGKDADNYAYALRFIGAEGGSKIQPQYRGPNSRRGKKNYITEDGNFGNVAQYGELMYRNIWKDINAKFYEAEGQMKYDFIVAPGADPARVRFVLDGAQSIAVNKRGELEFTTALGTLQKGVPFTYQCINGEEIEVTAAYQLSGDTISFKLGAYQTGEPLVIDPIALKYATFLGGSGNEEPFDIFVTDDFIYLTGETSSADFPITTGAMLSGGRDVFVTCLEKDGSAIVWSTVIGGTGNDVGYGISVDAAGDVYVSGSTRSSDFPTNGTTAAYSTLSDGNNTFVIRLNPTGSILKYSTYYPQGSSFEHRKVVVNDGNVYAIAQSIGFNATATLPEIIGINTNIAGPAGLVMTATLPSPPTNNVSYSEIEQAPDGSLWVVGYADKDPSFPISPNAVQSSTDFEADNSVPFVAKFSITGQYLYSSYVQAIWTSGETYGGTQFVPSLSVDDQGNVYVGSGSLLEGPPSSAIVTPKTLQVNELSPISTFDYFGSTEVMFIAKIPASLPPNYEFVSFLPAQTANNFSDPEIAVDNKGKIHIYNNASNAYGENFSFPYTEGAISRFNESSNSNSGSNYYVIDPTGSSVLYGTTVTEDFAYTYHGLFVDDDCTAYMTAIGGESGYPTTPSYRDQETGAQVSVVQPASNGSNDVHLAVFHEVEAMENTIPDFAAGNNTFCVGGLIYQDPNDGPIIGQEVTYISGDGSSPTHNLPDISFNNGASTTPHPQPGDATYRWQVSTDGGTTWENGTNGSFSVYKPVPESMAGTVQYRRLVLSGCCDTLISNVATATIAGNFTLLVEGAQEPIYYCPGTPKNTGISITGASGNISWQWYDAFVPIPAGIITPSSGAGTAASFSAIINATAAQAGSYRLVVTDAGGCKREQLVVILPLTEPAFVGNTAPICPGGTSDVIIGPAAVNPLFDYQWTGPAGFMSNAPNPTVSTAGTYTLQVKLMTDAEFCAAGATSVEVVSSGAFAPALGTIADRGFCQSDDPATIGLAGPAPAGYVFQWSPNINLDDATSFNPVFNPGSLPFDQRPIAEVEYTFTALRLSDGCIFETTTMVTDTALGFAFAGIDKIGDGCVTGMRTGIGGSESFGGNYEWVAVGTDFPGGLPTLTTDATYGLETVGQQVGTNKFLKANFPLAAAAGGAYYIDFELKASYVPFPTNCFTRDTMRLYIPPCGESPACPEPMATSAGTDGSCSSDMTMLSVNPVDGATYTWTTYSVDNTIQPANTPPMGLFNILNDVKDTPLNATGPHVPKVIADFDDPAWGWPAANQVVYQVTQTIDLGTGPLSCFSRLIVFSGNVAAPVIGLIDKSLCSFPSPGTQGGTSTNVTPYTISGADYTQAPNSGLIWFWQRVGGNTTSIVSGRDTPFPTLNPAASTSYAVSAQDPVTGCIAFDTVLVSIQPTIANAGPDVAGVCGNSLVRIGTSAQPNHTYQWSPTGGLEDPIGTPNSTSARPFLVVGTVAQSYTVTATNTLTGCRSTDVMMVTPTTAPPPAPGFPSTFVTCPGGSGVPIGPRSYTRLGVNFTWTAVSGGDVSWLSDPNVLNPIATPAAGFSGNAVFRLTVSDACGSASRDYTLNVVEADVELLADFTANCNTPYSGIFIQGSPTPGYSYIFSPTTGLFRNSDGTSSYFSGAAAFVAPPSEPITYTITATGPSGCTFSDQVTVSPPAGVGLVVNERAAYCPGGDPVVLATSSQGTIMWSAVGYSPNPQDGPFLPAPNAAQAALMLTYLSSTVSTPTSFSQAVLAAGKYQYEVASSNSVTGCTIRKQVTVIVPNTVGDLTGPAKSVCLGSSIQIGSATAPTTLSYFWEAINPVGANGTISNQNVRRPFVSPTVPTTYQVTARDNTTGCSSTKNVTISVTPSPVIANAMSPILCRPITNQDITALVTDYNTFSNPIWYRNSVPGNVVADPTMVLPTSTTTYFLVAENDLGCRDTAMVTLRLENVMAPTLPASITANCNAARSFNLATLTPTTPSIAGSTFEWHDANNTDAGSLVTNLVVMPGTYYLFEITANGCTSDGTALLVETPACFDLALTKTLASGQASSVAPGEQVTFTISIFNQDAAAANEIIIEDYAPTGLTLVSGSAWNADNTITLSVANTLLPAGGLTMANSPITVDVTYLVNASLTPPLTLVNQAEITSALNLTTGVVATGDVDSQFDNISTNNPGGSVGTASDDVVTGDGTGLPGATTAATDADNADPAQIMIAFMPVSIGDTVFVDLNNDGLLSTGEPGIGGVTVTVYDNATGMPVTLDFDGAAYTATVMTNSDGGYSFDNLPIGDYYVIFDITTADNTEFYDFTTANAGDDTLDSDADPTTGQTAPTGPIASGGEDLTLDAGVVCITAVTVADPSALCSTQSIDLTAGASVTPPTLAATWSSPDGNGTFDGGTNFGTATTYTPSAADAARGTVTLVLTSDDPAGPCGLVSAMVTFTILRVDCGTFPWDGSNN